MSNLIQNRQLVVWSDEALAYYLHMIDTVPNVSGALCQMDANPALGDFKLAHANGLSNPRMLAFAADCALWRGHVVVPYAIEKTASTTDFRFYNPNKPARTDDTDDGGSRIWVKESGEWGHKSGQTASCGMVCTCSPSRSPSTGISLIGASPSWLAHGTCGYVHPRLCRYQRELGDPSSR